MSFSEQEILVGITDIAEMARAKRAAVSNWPKRYADFPKPRVVTPSGALFDGREVERWLIVKGKIDGPVPPEVRLWKLVDRLRDLWSPIDITLFLAACIVYLEAGPEAPRTVSDVVEGAGDAWDAIRNSESADLLGSVIAAAGRIEQRNPKLSGIITKGLERDPRPDDALLRQVLDHLCDASAEMPLDVILNEALGRLSASDRSFAAAYETPHDLAELLIRLARPISGIVFDPAAGMCGLLQSAALYPDVGSHPDRVIGYELNEWVSRLARAQSFVYGIDVSLTGVDALIECRDSLREAAQIDVEADLVLLDPPFNQREWGDTDLYLNDELWRFGLPSPRSAEFAWVQLAINSLKPDGRAIVVLPAGAASTGGRASRIRKNLVQAGCVEAVIFVPARFSRDSAVPLSVWILRRPQAERSDWIQAPNDVLIVDATRLGSRSPLDQWADELDIDDIVNVVHFSENPGLILDSSLAISVEAELLADDGNLSFTHHRPLPIAPDLAVLAREVDELQGSLKLTVERLSDRVIELSEILKENS